MASVPKPPIDPLGRPVEDPLSVSQLERLLGEASRRGGWENADGYDLLEVWGSRTASIYRCRGRSPAVDVVVKIGHGWSAEDARRLHEKLIALRSRLDPSFVRSPEPLGWASDPASVCTRYVEGTDLYFMLLDLGHPAWISVGAAATAVLASCGLALAHIHAGSDVLQEGASRDAFGRMWSVASSLWLRPTVVSGAELKPVVGFGDVGPHQFRIADAGQIWVLDPPTDPVPALPHEDVATFLFGIDKLLGASNGLRTRSGRATRTALREAFLEGYGRAGVIDPRRALDRWLLRLFDTKLAAGTARRRIRERELLDAGRMLLRYAAGQLWLRWHRPGGPRSERR
jgi:hypothetical protein